MRSPYRAANACCHHNHDQRDNGDDQTCATLAFRERRKRRTWLWVARRQWIARWRVCAIRLLSITAWWRRLSEAGRWGRLAIATGRGRLTIRWLPIAAWRSGLSIWPLLPLLPILTVWGGWILLGWLPIS